MEKKIASETLTGKCDTTLKLGAGFLGPIIEANYFIFCDKTVVEQLANFFPPTVTKVMFATFVGA
jgi:hypothetical protein